jgi:hypothetical protein
MNRRTFFTGALTLPVALVASRSPARGAQSGSTAFQYPIAWPDSSPGIGFVIRHGYACENTWYNPGYLHTGEDCTGSGAADSHNERRQTDRARRRLTAARSAAGFALGFDR